MRRRLIASGGRAAINSLVHKHPTDLIPQLRRVGVPVISDRVMNRERYYLLF